MFKVPPVSEVFQVNVVQKDQLVLLVALVLWVKKVTVVPMVQKANAYVEKRPIKNSINFRVLRFSFIILIFPG